MWRQGALEISVRVILNTETMSQVAPVKRVAAGEKKTGLWLSEGLDISNKPKVVNHKCRRAGSVTI